MELLSKARAEPDDAPTAPAIAAVIVVATIVGAGCVGVGRYQALRRQQTVLEANLSANPIHVPLWVPRAKVRHFTRFASVWDGAAPLASFRHTENLDAVVSGATTDEQRARKLMHWTRAQFEPGRPDPYPPPNAMTTLSEIRSGRTGGFCAQYAFILVQALQSFGSPARVVTIEDHEVVETWLPDEARWTMFDPRFHLQIIDGNGRSLSAVEIRDARHAGTPLAISDENCLAEPAHRYIARLHEIALWIRNAFVSAPVNFADFDRYRVWLVRPDEYAPSPESLATTHPEGLYEAPTDFPNGNGPSGRSSEFHPTLTSSNTGRPQP